MCRLEVSVDKCVLTTICGAQVHLLSTICSGTGIVFQQRRPGTAPARPVARTGHAEWQVAGQHTDGYSAARSLSLLPLATPPGVGYTAGKNAWPAASHGERCREQWGDSRDGTKVQEGGGAAPQGGCRPS